MWYIIRQIFLKGGTIKDAIHYVFKATGKMPTKSEGMKIINVYQDVQKHSGKVIQFPKDKITNPFIPRLGAKTEEHIKYIKSLKPIDSMKEANKVIGRKGQYKKLTPEESQKILKDTEDHIFQRDIQYDEFGDPIKPEPDFASGGRIGFAEGKNDKGIMAAMKKFFGKLGWSGGEDWRRQSELQDYLFLYPKHVRETSEQLKRYKKHMGYTDALKDLLRSYAKSQSRDPEETWKNYKKFLEMENYERANRATGGIAGELHLNQGGRARFQDGALAAYQSGQNIVGPYDVSQYEAKGYSPGDLEFLSRTQIPTEAPEWYTQEQEKQKQYWDPTWGEYEAEPWEDMQEQAKVHMMRELGPYDERQFTNPNAVMMPPVGPVPPGMMGPGIVEPMSMGAPTYMTETGEAASGPGTGITRIDKPVTRNPLVDPRMYRSYAENVQLMGDPRMRGAKGGRASYTKGGLAQVLGV